MGQTESEMASGGAGSGSGPGASGRPPVGKTAFPVPLSQLASHLGLRIMFADPLEGQHALAPGQPIAGLHTTLLSS